MASSGVADPESRVGTTVAGRYFVHQLLARGGMGDVYKATLLGSDRPVALKLLAGAARADPSRVRRFEREAAAAARLHHPNLVELVDFGTAADGSPYLAMEYVPGRTLAQLIAEEAPLAPGRAVHLLAQVLAALADAHANGVVHRDLKPANVMIDSLRDGAGFVKVLDFGIAKLSEGPDGDDTRLTTAGMVHGTPAYMSPEQIRGEPLDARSDLYSAGVLLFELLSGALPFEAPTAMGIAARHLSDPVPRLRDRRPGLSVPPALEAVVASALEKDPAKRPGSAEAMRGALVAALAEPPLSARAGAARELPPTEALPQASARGPARTSARVRAAIVTGAAIAVVLVATSQRATPPPPVSAVTTPPQGAREPVAAVERAELRALSNAAPVQDRPRVRQRRPEAPRESPTIQLARGELNSVPTPSAATGEGVLVLVATPWADVSVEGIPLGETPREVRLRAGTYRVRAVHPELGVREASLTVEAGERKLWAARYEP